MIGLFRLLPHIEAYRARTTSLALHRALLQMASLRPLPAGILGKTNKAKIPGSSPSFNRNYISVNSQTGNEKSGFGEPCLRYREGARSGGKGLKALKQFDAQKSENASDTRVNEAQSQDKRAKLRLITGTQGACLI